MPVVVRRVARPMTPMRLGMTPKAEPGARPKMVTHVLGMHGLGDNIFQRAFVRSLIERRTVYLSTSWPEIYEDLPVRFVKRETALRTQAKNVRRQDPERWVGAPLNGTQLLRIGYGHATLATGSIVSTMQKCFGAEPKDWDLPAFPRMVRDKPIALVRPVTARKEWMNTARNPLPEYVAAVADDLMQDYHVISVADLVGGLEWLDGAAPPAHERYHRGELDVRALLGLVQSAAVVVGGVGWIVPAAIAAGVPLFCILGGHGVHNAPSKITDQRMDLTRVDFAHPDRFCMCSDMRHACDKRNSHLAEQWEHFCAAQGL